MKKIRIVLILVAILFLSIACSMPFAMQINPVDRQSSPSPEITTQTTDIGTDKTVIPSPTQVDTLETTNTIAPSTITPIPGTATEAPVCKILQPINLRRGPGTAFTPPITALDTDTTGVPLAFNPVGIPVDSWLKISVPSINQSGWINSGTQFVTCNIDITQLPSENVDAPPTPSPPMVSNTQPDGMLDAYNLDVKSSPTYLMEIRVKVKDGKKNGDGIKKVNITIQDKNGTVYQIGENSPLYCAFGGNSYCNSWPALNGIYTWGIGGPAVKKGTYTVVVDVIPKDSQLENGQCHFNLTLK